MKFLVTILCLIMTTTGVQAGLVFEKGVQASVETKYIKSADVDVQTGEVETVETYASFQHDFKWGQVPMDWTLGYKHIDIEESVALTLPSHLEGYSYSVGAKIPMLFMDADDKFLGFDVGVTFNTDDGVLESSAARFPIRSYFIHKWNEQFLWIVGAGFTADKDEEWQPLVGFQYKPNDVLSFNFVSTNPNIAYKVGEKWTLTLEGSIDSDEFEVQRDNDSNVVLKYKSYTAGVGARYAINDNIFAKISLGSAFNRRLDYADDQGKAVLDDALFASIKISAKF